MTVHLYQAYPKYNHSNMICRECVQLALEVYGIDDRIDTQIMKTPNDFLVHLKYLNNGRKPDIITLKKYMGDIFL